MYHIAKEEIFFAFSGNSENFKLRTPYVTYEIACQSAKILSQLHSTLKILPHEIFRLYGTAQLI